MDNVKQSVYTFLKDREWLELPPGDLAKSISIEAAELLEHFQWTNPSVSELKADNTELNELADEIADIMIYAIELCIILGLDPENVIKTKIDKASRKYPAERMVSDRDASSSNPANNAYYKIKSQNREK